MKNPVLSLSAAAAVSLSVGCGSMWYQGKQGTLVPPGAYPGVRTDLSLIGSLPSTVKNAQGGDKVVTAMCMPFGAVLVAADVPLSLVADTCTLPADIKQIPSETNSR